MTGNELHSLLEGDNKVLCKTKEGIYEDGIFGDKGMIVEVSFARDDGECYEVVLDGTKYIDHNHSAALPNWYDSDHNPTLKYFEVYTETKEISSLYLDYGDDDIGLELVESNSLSDEYLKNRVDGETYVSWMEKLVNELRG